ncbi:putative epidermal cell surface receptor isoform X2 [Copidosoma floridanum]|uniref:putative epidermal cell surface receptor isoform X2 n=1 Tax=Copidosoma floridanum TaxID=29053 RepID=UPI0006C98AF2|nr:putative epidermal cell surface receptor isoform X2 [Copidosoma floridanum]
MTGRRMQWQGRLGLALVCPTLLLLLMGANSAQISPGNATTQTTTAALSENISSTADLDNETTAKNSNYKGIAASISPTEYVQKKFLETKYSKSPDSLKHKSEFSKHKDAKGIVNIGAKVVEEKPTTEAFSTIGSVPTTLIQSTSTERPGKSGDVAPETTKVESTTRTMEMAPRARALNVTANEPNNVLNSGNFTDLSDVSMDDEDKEIEDAEYNVAHNSTLLTNATMPDPLPKSSMVCIDGNKTYAVGEKIKRGCEEQCSCEEDGKITNCTPMCQTPLVRAGRKHGDPFCHARDLPENPCCAILVCTDSAPEPEETCVLGNNTVSRGQKIEDGCTKTCICEAGGHLKCQPRCPPNDTASSINQHDRCVILPDPRDSCCTITLCDVTLGDHEIKLESPTDLSVNLTDVKVLNSTAIKLKLSSKSPDEITIEISENNHRWTQVKPTKEGIISNLQPAHSYYVRVIDGTRAGPAIHVSLLAEVTKTSVTEKSEKGTCSHRGKIYKIGAEWYDECIAFCVCNETAHTECVTIECPTDFGLDVLDPHCLDWETVPPNHVPKAPNCCPQEVRCRNNGSCTYEGKTYDNWSRLPTNVTGCEKECYCEFGNVTCHSRCPKVSPHPPSNLNCKPSEAVLTQLPGEDCCLQWACPQVASNNVPGKNNTVYVYPGPVAIDTSSKKPKDKSESTKPSQDSSSGSSYPWPISPSGTHPPQPAMPPNSDVVHYPMDPGHPTAPYIGPYNPDYKPTQPSVEEVFHLSPSHVEKTPSIKEKTKSKSDSKKPVDAFKPSKEVVDQFPGPLAPDRFAEKVHPSEKPTLPPPLVRPNNPNLANPQSPNKLPGLNKGSSPTSNHAVEQPQFIPLNIHDHDFTPSNGENIPPTHFDTLLENPAAGPPYGGHIGTGLRPDSADPNNIVPSTASKKKIPGSDIYTNDKGKGLPPKRPDVPPRQEVIPDELYHLINLQHPGLINLDRGQPGNHPGLYDIHQEIGSGTEKPHAPPPYFGQVVIPPKKGGKPQIYTQKDENGQTTYHVHSSEIPNSPQQLEELLTHIAQHDPHNNPYQQYPVNQQQPGVPLQRPPPPALSPHGVDLETSQVSQNAAGVPAHIGPHGFVAQAPLPPGADQSGFEHGLTIGQFPGILGHGGQNLPAQQAYEIAVDDLRAVSANTVRLMFNVPSVLVGLHGRVEVRYTSDKSNIDPSTWKSQTFAPPGDLIDSEDLEFDLSGLKPSTVYKLMIVVKLRDLSNTHTSKIYQVRTLDKPAPNALPSDIRIDAELRVLEVNSSFAEFEWKKFTNYELQFIDGIYLMYKAENEKTYSVTPLLHRSVNHYVLDHLQPSTTYEVHLSTKDIIGQANVLVDSKTVNFTTVSESDPYLFDVKVEIKTIKATDVEVSWSGVPHPQDKYVNIYRAVYQSDSGKEDTSTFKIAKKDSPAKTIISDLKPGTRYRLWIEVYLTNGKVKKSNVQDFVTKPGILLPPGASQQQGKLASIQLHEGDYYGPLVIVAIVASLAILSSLILLMMLMKRRTSSKADISPRKTTSAYDNPSYKVELQQETMDL